MKEPLRKTGEFLLRGLLSLFALPPLKVHRFNAVWLAFLVRKVFRYRVALVRENLRHAFPEMSEAGREKVLCDFYRHLADIIVEAVWFGGCRRGGRRLRRSRIVSVKNPEVLDAAYRKSPSVMVMYTHAGNWELLGGVENYNHTGRPFPVREDNFCVVYLRQTSRTWDNIMKSNRFAPLKDSKAFDGYVESRSLVRYALTHRTEKKIYNVNTDQRPYFSAPDFIRVNFLNRECNTMSASAALAAKLGMSVFYQRMEVNENGCGYSIEYVPVCDDASKMSVEDMMHRYYALLEGDIRKQPFNYLWTHNRWG